MTAYGEYRDATARALAALLGAHQDPQLSATQIERVLGCRDLLLASLQQQFRLATGAAGSSNLQLASVESNPVSALGAVLDRVPMVGPRDAPTDVLTTGPDEASYVASWRQAARWSLLAADVLDTTHAWRTDQNAAWAAVADAAQAAWALSLLDTDLATHQRPDGTRNRTEAGGGGLGLLARLTVDLANQGAFNRNLDSLTRPAPARVGPRPLSQFSQVVDGEERVARMLQQSDGVVPVRALGPLLVGQARIAAAVAKAATRLQPSAATEHGFNGHERDTAAALAGAARARAEALTAAAKARKGVADVLTGGEPLVWQTAEVLRALQRRPQPTDRVQAVAQLRQLHRLTEIQDAAGRLLVAGILAAFARGEYLVPHPDRNQLQWRPMTTQVELPLREAAESYDQVRLRAVLPRRLDAQPSRTPAVSASPPSQLLTHALAARQAGRPESPGMRIGQPLTP